VGAIILHGLQAFVKF